jgi:enterochelin esterase-like enzyme
MSFPALSKLNKGGRFLGNRGDDCIHAIRRIAPCGLWLFLGMAALAHAQSTAPATTTAPEPPVVSPEVHSDGTVTFRLRAPGATTVSVSIESLSGTTAMTKDRQGVWSATLGPLPPDVYTYGFSVDGVRMLDPANPAVQPRRSLTASLFEVPAAKPRYYDFQPVSHGVVRLEEYWSKSLGRLRTLRVYTPPGYDQDSRVRYPVLFLLHGYGDNESTWAGGAGRASWIADNLLAQGQATPMIIVMPDGHAVAPVGSGHDPKANLRNLQAFEGDLLHDVIPFLEANYRVQAGREHRAIIGVSMGGRQSLTIGLQHPELFA